MCNLVMVIGPWLVCIEWLLHLLLWVGGAFCYSVSCSQPSHLFVGAYIQPWGLTGESPDPSPSLHDGEGSSFPGLVPSDDAGDSESVMGIEPGDSDVVIGYQVDEFTCTWSAEQFVACSHIYPGFTGKVSSLTHFPMEPGCEDYTFLDQAVADFEQGLDFILTDPLKTPELDTSLEEADAITSSSVSSGFLCLGSTLSNNSKPQLAPTIWTHKLWCQARALLAPVSLATKMSASKLIHYFFSHSAAFGFQASTPPDNISLNSANRKADQSQIFRLVLAPLHMLLLTQSNSSRASGLSLLILFPHCLRLREMLYLCLKCMNYFSRFMAFWTWLFPSELEIQHAF